MEEAESELGRMMRLSTVIVCAPAPSAGEDLGDLVRFGKLPEEGAREGCCGHDMSLTNPREGPLMFSTVGGRETVHLEACPRLICRRAR